MNPWRIILFTGILILPAWGQAQDVQAYLTRRWLQAGEELRMIVTCRGAVPIAAPEFPEIAGFELGDRYVNVQHQGASRITIYNQAYVPDTTGTFVIPPIIIPFEDQVIRRSPGIITVRKASSQSLAGYQASELEARLVWDIEAETLQHGKIQHGTLYLEVPVSQRNNLIWDLGGLAEMADSIRRSNHSLWILHDSLKNDGLAQGEIRDNIIRYPCYEAWWGCPGDPLQTISGTRLRIQRRWTAISQYRGARGPVPRWKDEFVDGEAADWHVISPTEAFASQIAPTGPLSMSLTWQNSDLQTGEPLAITATIAGNAYLALIPDPQFEIPEGLVLRGPQVRTMYEASEGTLLGTKTLSYLLYPAVAGSYVLPKAKLFWTSTERAQVDSVVIPLPIVTVTGEPIPQLLEQQKLEAFYQDSITGNTSGRFNSFAWLLPMAYSLFIGAAIMLGVSVRAHRHDRQQKRRQRLRSKRYKGH